jgi:3-hydroxymyristoyl/3-hydroxydecanoyl-(acyl carrier protein) dehydratase
MTTPQASGFEFVVAGTHPALPGHFPGRPIVPGVLLLDEVLRGIESRIARSVAGLQQVRFVSALLPGETARVSLQSDEQRVKFVVQAQRDGAAATLASGSVLLSPRVTAP